MLAVSLAGGSHTVALQWSAQGSVPWYVINGIGSTFQVSVIEWHNELNSIDSGGISLCIMRLPQHCD